MSLLYLDIWKSFIAHAFYLGIYKMLSLLFSLSVLSYPMDCSMPGLPVHHKIPDFAQIHFHWVTDAIQLSQPLSSTSLPAFNLSQHWGHFQRVGFSHQLTKVLELHHQYFQWIFRVDLFYFILFLFLLYFTLQYCIGFAINWHESTTLRGFLVPLHFLP